MSIEEFWEIYNKEYQSLESPSFCIVDYPLAGDTGRNLFSIYVNDTGRYCVDKTLERCNSPAHKEYDREEDAVKKIIELCELCTGHKYEK